MPPVRAALLSYFELDDLPRLLDAVAASGMPPATRIHIGTYGVNRDTSDLVRAWEGGRYSPMFKTQPTEAWEGRRLSPREEALVGPRFRGRVPPERDLLRL